ncbi:leucine-rich repeat domain-containing protein [Psychrobacter sp. AOP7-D1-15]|uniref:leucine-rich repeat domain-containing protein n=1 Tax=unclassified Psychrobacter TaxID=196806 RepID=UPI001867EFF3|nr:hypothetical protein [Psychrobacter sp. FME61]
MENVNNSDNEKWMKEIWDWADKSSINESVIPRDSIELLGLKSLYINYNSKIKNIPECIGNLKNLESIILEEVDIEKLPDSIGRLLKLKNLSINDNDKIIELPESIGNLINLESINLQYTSIEKIPDSVDKLLKLKKLNIIVDSI